LDLLSVLAAGKEYWYFEPFIENYLLKMGQNKDWNHFYFVIYFSYLCSVQLNL